MSSLTAYHKTIGKIIEEVKRTFIGNEHIIRTLMVGFFGRLSVLIEDIPGVGKTTLAKSLAAATGMDFGRIQFTPDLLPGDILGMTIWSQEKRDFIFKQGAILHQFILADEINRASARTQSALLEAMQEAAVTVDGTTHPLPQPFFVVATQNPSHYAGTFQLPEAQVDRFGISLTIGYPDSEREITILETCTGQDPFEIIHPVITPPEIIEIRNHIQTLRVERKVKEYLTRISGTSRKNKMLKTGMSPRATLHLLSAARAHAFLNNRDYVIPEDVLGVAHSVLAHRLVLSPDARMENKSLQSVIKDMLEGIPLPSGLE
jgi:MoxR-like ATPase